MLDLIETTLRVAGKTLSDAITFWYPAEGNVDIPERTLSGV